MGQLHIKECTYVHTCMYVGVCTNLSLFLSRQKTEREAVRSRHELEQKLHIQENMVHTYVDMYAMCVAAVMMCV